MQAVRAAGAGGARVSPAGGLRARRKGMRRATGSSAAPRLVSYGEWDRRRADAALPAGWRALPSRAHLPYSGTYPQSRSRVRGGDDELGHSHTRNRKRYELKLLYTDTLNEPLELNLKDKLRKLEYSDVIQVEKTDTFKAYANDIGGRFSVFLTAKGRYKLNQIIQPHKKYIKYVHTDGWISSKELDLTLSDEFGGVRLDKKGDVEIINKNFKKFI